MQGLSTTINILCFFERVDVREYMPQQRRNHGRSFYRRLDVSTFRTRRPCRITVSLCVM